MKNYIYGAGHYSSIITKELLMKGLEFDLIIDKYTEKTELHGLPIVNSAEGLDVNAKVWLIISSFHTGGVIEELRKIGFSNFIPLGGALKEAEDCIPKITENMIWYRSNQPFVIDEDKLNNTIRLLSNQESVDTLKNIVSFRKNPAVDTYVNGDTDTHYFSKNVPWSNTVDSFDFVDCGAFTGDTLTSLVEVAQIYNKKISSVTLFEPEASNRAKLLKVVSQQQKFKSYVYPCGVWSKSTFLSFSNSGSSSHIASNGEGEGGHKIMCVDIDSALIGAKPNWIKMDIEGSEIEAILGARDVIMKYSPVLTIAIYHKPYDLWDIPLLINEINPDYDMYIRAHGDFTTEVVLYCIPKNG
jgi:FkbM family methyltransferase